MTSTLLERLQVFAVLVAGAVILLLPAIVTGRPFIYWDTPTFYSWGHDILTAIGHPWPALAKFPQDFPAHRGLWAADNMRGAWKHITATQFQLVMTSIGSRSDFYAVPLYALGSTLTIWTPTFLQALIAAWLLWVASSLILPAAGVLTYVFLTAVLTLMTAAPFFVGYLMPDVFAAYAILATSLLLCFYARLTRRQRLGLAALLAFSCVVHLSILPTQVGLVITGFVILRVFMPELPRRGAVIAALGIVCAVAGLLASNAALASLFGEPVRPPPFVEGRVIVDGPGQLYLRQVCATKHFAACRYKDSKLYSIDDIIWPDVSWHHLPLFTNPAKRRQFLNQQDAVVLGTLTHYPLKLIGISLRNIGRQLVDMRISKDVGQSLSGLLDAHSDRTLRVEQFLPDLGPCLRSKGAQACDYWLPLHYLQKLQSLVVYLGVVFVLLMILPRLARRSRIDSRSRRVAVFALVVLVGVLGNAIVCGGFSGAWGRYQARVAWLVPMMAVLLLQASPVWLRIVHITDDW